MMQNSEAPPAGQATAQSHVPAASNRAALLIVFLVVFIDLLGFGIVLPLLPRIAERYVDYLLPSGQQALSGFILGMLMASFSLMQLVFAPIWGSMSDRVGRRPILLLGLLGSVIFYALFGYAASLPASTSGMLALVLFFVARAGAGIAGATIATAQAVIADSTPPEKRKHGMALIGAAFGIGFTFGPLIGFASLTFFENNPEAIGYTAATLSLIALILGLRMLPETRRFDTATAGHRRFSLSALMQGLGRPGIGPVMLVFFLATLGFGAFEVTLALLLKDSFGFTERGSLLIFAYVGFVLMLTQGFLYRRLAKRVSEATFIAMGIVLMAAGVGLLGAVTYAASQGTPMLWLLFVALTLAVIGFAFLTPSAQALISRRTDESQQGEILGVNQSSSALARILGPILGITLYKMTATHLLPYVAGAGLLILMLPLLPRIRRG